MKNRIKITSVILSIVMIFSVFNIVPFTVSASEIDTSALGATPDEVNREIQIGEIGHFSSDSSIWYRFVPKEDMAIKLDLVVPDDHEPPWMYIYDESFELLDSGYASLSYFVMKGHTYYFNTYNQFTDPDIECILRDQPYYGEIKIGEKKTAYIENGGDVAYFKYTPVKDMVVSFSSNSDEDTYGYVYDEGMNQLAEDDESGNGSNFKVNARVTAGETYIFASKFYGSSTTGSFEVTLQEPPEWEYSVWGSGMTEITGYNGSDTEVVIPSEIDGHIITDIGHSVFRGNESITGIIIPDTVKRIGSDAFHGCDSLQEIIIPDSVNSIGSGVFISCDNLKKITLPNNINIPDSAFQYCYALESINIPSSLTEIGESAFSYCNSLTGIVLPEGLLSIGNNAFNSCASLESVIIPSTVEEIGYSAFEHCKNLTEVTISYGVYTIGSKAFGYYREYTGIYDYYSYKKVDGFTIKGYTDSVAEEYAEENGFDFVSIGQAPPKPTLSFTPKYSYEYIENYNGYRETDDSDEFVYYAPSFNDGDKLSIDYHDERGSIDYIFVREVWAFEDENGNRIDADDVIRSNGFGWTVGGENSFTLTYKNMSTEVPVSVVKPEDASLRFIPKKPYELIENREGYTDGGYFRYYTPKVEKGDKLIIDYGDKTVTYTYGSKPDDPIEWYGYNFYDEDGQSIRYSVNSDQYHSPWNIGSDNYFIVTALGKTAIVPVTIIEYPVESIEFKLASPIIMYENQDGNYYCGIIRLDVDEFGYYYYDYADDEPKKIYKEPTVFRYNQIPVFKDGNKLIIHYKDGSTKSLTQRFIFTEEDNGYFFVDENGDYDKNVSFDWDGTSFKLGSDNQLTVKYLDTATTVPVTVVENNIESIEYQPVKPIVYNLDDPKDVYIGDEYEVWLRVYNERKIHDTGSILTVHFKDGTTKKYTFYSVSNIRDGKYNPVLGARYYAVDEEGSVIGYSSLTFDYNTSDWSPGNTYYMTVGYLGATTQVPITVTSRDIQGNILGDVDSDNNIEVIDATWIQRHVSEVEMPFIISNTTADVDGDGSITVMDATAIQYYLANMKTSYKIGEKKV